MVDEVVTDLKRKLLMLEQAERDVKHAIDAIDSCWGEEEERKANPTPFMRMADARNLAERAGQKLRKAITILTGKRG